MAEWNTTEYTVTVRGEDAPLRVRAILDDLQRMSWKSYIDGKDEIGLPALARYYSGGADSFLDLPSGTVLRGFSPVEGRDDAFTFRLDNQWTDYDPVDGMCRFYGADLEASSRCTLGDGGNVTRYPVRVRDYRCGDAAVKSRCDIVPDDREMESILDRRAAGRPGDARLACRDAAFWGEQSFGRRELCDRWLESRTLAVDMKIESYDIAYEIICGGDRFDAQDIHTFFDGRMTGEQLDGFTREVIAHCLRMQPDVDREFLAGMVGSYTDIKVTSGERTPVRDLVFPPVEKKNMRCLRDVLEKERGRGFESFVKISPMVYCGLTVDGPDSAWEELFSPDGKPLCCGRIPCTIKGGGSFGSNIEVDGDGILHAFCYDPDALVRDVEHRVEIDTATGRSVDSGLDLVRYAVCCLTAGDAEMGSDNSLVIDCRRFLDGVKSYEEYKGWFVNRALARLDPETREHTEILADTIFVIDEVAAQMKTTLNWFQDGEYVESEFFHETPEHLPDALLRDFSLGLFCEECRSEYWSYLENPGDGFDRCIGDACRIHEEVSKRLLERFNETKSDYRSELGEDNRYLGEAKAVYRLVSEAEDIPLYHVRAWAVRMLDSYSERLPAWEFAKVSDRASREVCGELCNGRRRSVRL